MLQENTRVLVEEMKKSLFVLERYIPRFFDNATMVYDELMIHTNNGGINKNIFKPKITMQLQKMLLHNFSNELDFYEFCKARLHKQYLSLL